MRSLKTYNQNKKTYLSAGKGFTLIELIVVVALLGIIATFGSIVSLDFYRVYSFRSERSTVVNLLQQARTEAMNNVCLGSGCTGGKAHGVRFDGTSYILFQGNSFDPTDPTNARFSASPSANLVTPATPFDVVFAQLSGVSTPVDITLTDPSTPGRTDTIRVSSEGQINW